MDLVEEARVDGIDWAREGSVSAPEWKEAQVTGHSDATPTDAPGQWGQRF